ncbi:DedA family protein [Alphaproteobacteria bacterium]|nr:DedA family protein [Alphaproteobacteria bacterium]MDC0148370.1 DedA family protein [Alphaproteobacteria bacterium]
MLRKIYDKTIDLSRHRNAAWGLAGVSFAESSFFPIPPDVMLIPMVLADRAKAWRNALICTLASVAGAALGYAIGMFLWDAVGAPVIAIYGAEAAFEKFTSFYEAWGVWIVLAAAISFLPFKVATLASGLTGLSFVPFLLTSLVGRGIRFFAVAGLVYYFGPSVRVFLERYFNVLSMLALGLLFLLVIFMGQG